jgi:hypothetical protein
MASGQDRRNGDPAKTAKLIGTSIGGLSARYSVVAHYRRHARGRADRADIRVDTNKPHCMQAWNVIGTRAK